MSQSIDRHLESNLGRIARGWSASVDATSIQVCLFIGQPTPGTVTYATLGLSRHVLDMPDGRTVRQELLLSVAERFASDDLPKLLAHVADGILRDHRALLRGEVLPLGHPISRGSGCDSLYVAIPVVFPAGLAICSGTQPATVFAWLVPIHPAEVAFVSRHGWDEFETRLEHTDPDLFDLERTGIT